MKSQLIVLPRVYFILFFFLMWKKNKHKNVLCFIFLKENWDLYMFTMAAFQGVNLNPCWYQCFQ